MTASPVEPVRPSRDATFALQGGLSAPLVIGLAIVLVIEGAVLHLWVASRSQPWAWVVTGINVLTLVWLWREQRATARSVIRVGEHEVEVVAGSRLRCVFPRSVLAAAEVATWRSVPDYATDFVNVAKPLEPNVVLTFRAPVSARLPLGVTKRLTRIGLRVETPSPLLAQLGSDST